MGGEFKLDQSAEQLTGWVLCSLCSFACIQYLVTLALTTAHIYTAAKMDRSLDDMISEKRASRPHRQRRDDVPTQKERVERQAPARRDQPYAVCLSYSSGHV